MGKVIQKIFNNLSRERKINYKKSQKALLWCPTCKTMYNYLRGKDFGIIIENFKRDLGWDTYILTLPRIEESSGWISTFIETRYPFFSFIKWVRKLKPELLITFHLTFETLIYAILFKIINPKGKVYVKADCDLQAYPKHYSHEKGLSIAYRLALKVLTFVAYVSFENKRDCDINQKAGINVLHIPNVIDILGLPKHIQQGDGISAKENILLTVGRLESYQKNTQEFLEIARQILEKDLNFKAILIGEITDETNFKEYLEDFFHQNPYLKSRIIFTGNISQIEVFEWYKRAKYLVMSSRREGFAHVFAEAAYFSTLIISRDVGGVRDITNDGEFGYIYSDIEDILPLIKTQYIDMKKYQKYILDNYTYQITLQRICKEILGK